ncbi:MAG: aldo/keto reductase, partial [Spirochaeta sp.]|nr:aldo/keto reductase [Spirochaeta sp.]
YEWLREIYESETGRQRIETVEKLRPVADDLGASLAQLALAWALKNPNVSTVITGASKAEQVKENMKALDLQDKLTPEIMTRIDDTLGNRPKPPRTWR